MKPIKKAVTLLGSVGAVAKVCGVSAQAVCNWAARGAVPAEHCPDIEAATAGKVRCEDLNPTINWSYLRATDCPTTRAA